MPAKGVFPTVREVRGQLVRRCVDCKKEKPVEEFYERHRHGEFSGWHSACKLCWALRRGRNAGLVPFGRIKFALTELVNRVGKAEAARRIGTTDPNLWRWMNFPPVKIRRKHASAILIELKEARVNNEVRHRDDIKSGAEIRGKPVRTAERREELYHQYFDKGAAEKNKRRKNNPEVKKREYEAKKRWKAKKKAKASKVREKTATSQLIDP